MMVFVLLLRKDHLVLMNLYITNREIDSTKIVVCHNRRINSHKVFQCSARRGQTTTGWFYGFKLHLFDLLYGQGIQLITKLKKNMKNKLMHLVDKILLRKRAIIETIIDQLKNISQIEHTRHRNPINFMVNAVSSLIAYIHKEKKPSLNIRVKDISNLPGV
jgi:hypothetical protein